MDSGIDDGTVDRRTYLKSTAAVVLGASVAGCGDDDDDDEGPPPETPVDDTPTPTEEPTPTPDGESVRERFERVVDMVEDAGCDPTGETPCDDELQEAAGSDTLLVFPEGEYFFESHSRILETENFGMLGEGDVTFVSPPRINEDWFWIDRGRDLLVDSITFDISADGATPALNFGVTDGLHLRNLTMDGQGIHPDSRPRNESGGNPEVEFALKPKIRSEEGTGLIENFVAKNGGMMGAYNLGNGRGGVWIGGSHQGTLTLRDCRVEEFPNNGVYGSRTPGVVRVEGGVFRNNDISQVRLAGEGSYVDGASIEVDTSESDSPNPGDALNQRGIWFEGGSFGYAGAEARNCTVHIENAPRSNGGIAISRMGGGHRILGTDVRVNADGTPGIHARIPDGNRHDPPPEPHRVIVRDVEITGSAAERESIRIEGRSGSIFENVSIEQTGTGRDGIVLANSYNCTINGGSLVTARYPVVIDGGADVESCLVHMNRIEQLEATTLDREDGERLETQDIQRMAASPDGHLCLLPSFFPNTDLENGKIGIISLDGGVIIGQYLPDEE